MKKLLTILTISTLAHWQISTLTWAIDTHFSQFYASPLTLNPALTGLSYGNVRFSANYRNQWAAISPFHTFSGSLDMSVLENSKNYDYGGLGIVAINDISGLGFKDLRAMFSLAYHKSLGVKNNHYLALGIQGGIKQLTLGFDDLTTQNQWLASQGFDETKPNGELFNNTNIINPDFQFGLFWYGLLGKSSTLFSGISMFHLAEPVESFFENSDNRLSRRYVFHGGSRIAAGSNIMISPNVIIMQQNMTNEINIGAAIEYNFSKQAEADKIVSLGGWYRNKDAVIIVVSLEYKVFNIGISYDVNISGLQNVTNNKGGFEITLTYNFKKPASKITQLSTSPCPRL